MSSDPNEVPYSAGELIGKSYEVVRVLGAGGFGVVYLVRSLPTQDVLALKTLRDSLASDLDVRNRFEREAKIWVELGSHPCIVQAHFVERVHGRLVIACEYIAPSPNGFNSLEAYLARGKPPLRQHLRWAIELCFGMSHTYARGLKAHRDLKPSNLLIDATGRLRIADFGLASKVAVLDAIRSAPHGDLGASGLHPTRRGDGFGTLPYMPPEQWTNARDCDERSDIYSAGIVLFQMAAEGRLPFTPAQTVPADQWPGLYCEWHARMSVPRVDSPLMPIIAHCLAKAPRDRYQSFEAVRRDLGTLLYEVSGETVSVPGPREQEALELHNRGMNLYVLGRYEDALPLLDDALPKLPWCLEAWLNKAVILEALCRFDEALEMYDACTRAEPNHAGAWVGRGHCLNQLGRYTEALDDFGRALVHDPNMARAWTDKGSTLCLLDRADEALACFQRALEIDGRDPPTWFGLANTLEGLGRLEEALRANENGLRLDPLDVAGWFGKATLLARLDRVEEGLSCLDRAAEINPADVLVLFLRAGLENQRGKVQTARQLWEEFLRLADAERYPWERDYVRQRLAAVGDQARRGTNDSGGGTGCAEPVLGDNIAAEGRGAAQPAAARATKFSDQQRELLEKVGRHVQDLHPERGEWLRRMQHELPARFHPALDAVWEKINRDPAPGGRGLDQLMQGKALGNSPAPSLPSSTHSSAYPDQQTGPSGHPEMTLEQRRQRDEWVGHQDDDLIRRKRMDELRASFSTAKREQRPTNPADDLPRPRFPWLSAVFLLYPLAAAIHTAMATSAGLSEVVGYGLSNLGFVRQ